MCLSVELQPNVGCFMMDPPSLGPTFCDLSASAVAMACIATLAASVTACATAAFELVCQLSSLLICLPSFDFLSLP